MSTSTRDEHEYERRVRARARRTMNELEEYERERAGNRRLAPTIMILALVRDYPSDRTISRGRSVSESAHP